MHIAFDAKRVYHNRVGLGNYSRNLLEALLCNYPNNRYSLFTPQGGELFSVTDHKQANVESVEPSGIYRVFPSMWRTYGMIGRVDKLQPDIYHGLSHELPFGIGQSKVKSVVTIHDLIFERYPQWYKPIDRQMYRYKYRYACRVADKIIAIGRQSANDLQEFWGVPSDKISIVKQSCNKSYWQHIDETLKTNLLSKYNLPSEFILQVGTIEPRKNHKASVLALAASKSGMPLVMVGRKTSYAKELIDLIDKLKLTKRVIFLQDVPMEHLPVLYQKASLTLFPSVFEGFGLPVLESIVSGTPVITTNKLCFDDAGGDAAIYVSPDNSEEFAAAIDNILTDTSLRDSVIEKCRLHRLLNTPELFAEKTMAVYSSML